MSTKLYGNMKPTPETIALDSERGRSYQEGLIVRTATYFQFVDKETGEYVTPFYQQSTKEFWQGVRMICLVASLVGRSRNIIQAGYWGVGFADLHFVLMEIDDITGMFLGKELSWRKGKEFIIWLHTQEYAYALQEAVEPYRAIWNKVLASWKHGHGGRSGAFKLVDKRRPQPCWWTGKQDWAALLAYKEADDEDKNDDKGEDEDEGKNDDDNDDNENGNDKKDGGKTNANCPPPLPYSPRWPPALLHCYCIHGTCLASASRNNDSGPPR